MNDETWTIHTDGGSRGNPGPAAYGYVIKPPHQPAVEGKGFLGRHTNNVAEYMGLLKSLERALALGAKQVQVLTDSELMVKQMLGQYRVRNEGLIPLYEQAKKLSKQFASFHIRHVYREQNTRADALCNEALDNPSEVERSAPPRLQPPAAPSVEAIPRPVPGSTDARAIALLKDFARAWARDPVDAPAAEVVWENLKALLKG